MPRIGLWVCLAALLGAISNVFAACDATLTSPTYTPRIGIVQPQINSCGWGSATNNNWTIVDSSVAVLGKYSNFSSSVTISTLAVVNQITTADGNVMMSGFNTSGNFYAGYAAGFSVTPGPAGNTGIGFAALQNASGNYNTALGPDNLVGVSGANNTALGSPDIFYNAGLINNNTAVGAEQFVNQGLGANDNTTVGYNIFNLGIRAQRNTVVGSQAMKDGTSASSNTVVGYGAGYGTDLSSSVVTGAGNTFLGYEAGTSTSAVINRSIAIGYGATVASSNTAQIGGINGSGSEVMLKVSSITVNQLIAPTVSASSVTLTGFIQLASLTKSALAALTPGFLNQLYRCSDCATVPVCISTDTIQGSFALITNKTAACQ